ncbi:MAG TPA: SpoIIE family protein phosphatase, partial [Gemmatimonadales bacterium]|nr:SpoIIE family protein phosphatase [Gemmatimonadales bacterium]
LVVAMDALGHGPLAAAAALRAAQVFADGAGDPIGELCRRVHRALAGGRGVVVSLASFDGRAGMMTWAGIGNVEGVLVRGSARRPATRSGLVTLGGILGGEFPEVRAQQLPIDPGDVVVFATDGVSREFVNAVDATVEPSQLAANLLAQFHKGTDDALVLAIRYTGREQ